jgi:2-iminoacetate synthase
MIFNPEKCSIPDERMKPFMDPDEIWSHLNEQKATPERVREVIAKAIGKDRLTLAETAILINADDPGLIEEIKQGARTLKEKGLRQPYRTVCTAVYR